MSAQYALQQPATSNQQPATDLETPLYHDNDKILVNYTNYLTKQFLLKPTFFPFFGKTPGVSVRMYTGFFISQTNKL
ncbi:MAG: hypothetical protein LBH44_08195 [Treponema sp.]|jgi:hypothetical protein|nr:hypothetical protein [Treponema sp.]